MARFFIDTPIGNTVTITGDDHLHLSKSLRMKISEKIVACDGKIEYNCIVKEITKSETICEILAKNPIISEASVEVFVYVSATKGDKLELVTQKITELGANSITVFNSNRSIVKFDDKSAHKRRERLQKIATEASKQSGRGKILQVNEFLSFKNMAKDALEKELAIVLYENEKNTSLKEIISNSKFEKIAVIVGPEGGFDESEIKYLTENNIQVATLGNRILRAETAPIACVCAIMFETGNLS